MTGDGHIKGGGILELVEPTNSVVPAGEGIGAYERTESEVQSLVQQYSSQIVAAAKRVFGQVYDQVLDDLGQEVSINIWRVLQRGEPIQDWKAFVYHCAHKRALDLLKKRRRRARREVSFCELREEDEWESDQFSVHLVTEVEYRDAVFGLLEEELANLPSPIKMTLLLRLAEGYSRAEVAEMLHCSKATVDYRLREGLQRLRKRMRRHGFGRGSSL
ncbi:MAG: RNA polymerase sigma factor [Acidobacteria bacterium]|nr:RNA polymerase sigma factor [Acidobacteriota bacterium]